MREREKAPAPSGLRLVRSDSADRPRAEFSAAEKRRIFTEMVMAELEGGLLRYSRRRALLRYAEDIGIAAFDANLLIAQAQHRARQLDPIEFDTMLDFPTATHPEAWPAGYRLLFALVTAGILNLMLVAWLLR